MKNNKKAKKAGALALIIILGSIGTLGVMFLDLSEQVSAKKELPEDHLFVEDTYLLKTGETNETVNVTCTPYMTNIWDEDSGNIKVIAYVVKTSNKIADFKNTVEIGKIKADTTAELEIPIILSADTFRVDMLVFENDKMVLKGSFSITAEQKFYYSKEGDITRQEWELQNSKCDFIQIAYD